MRANCGAGAPVTPDLQANLDAIGRALLVLPPSDLPGILGELERLKAAAWMRTTLPAPYSEDRDAPEANLSAQKAARSLGVSLAWIYKNARRLPFTLRIGRRLLFSARGLERWNKQRQGR